MSPRANLSRRPTEIAQRVRPGTRDQLREEVIEVAGTFALPREHSRRADTVR